MIEILEIHASALLVEHWRRVISINAGASGP